MLIIVITFLAFILQKRCARRRNAASIVLHRADAHVHAVQLRKQIGRQDIARRTVSYARAAPYAQHVAVKQQRVAMCAIASVTFFATTRSRTAAGADAIRQSSSVEIGSKTSSTAANGADAGQFAGPTAVTQGSVQTANAAATRKSAAQGAFTASVSNPSSPTDETQTAPAHRQLSDEELKREVQRRRQQQLVPFGLTERETQIVVMLLDGQTMKGIAEELFITERTVKFHSKNAYEKIGVASKKELMQAFSDLPSPRHETLQLSATKRA